MQKKFKFYCNRYSSERVAFAPPKNFITFFDREIYDFGISFISPDCKYLIHIYYGYEKFEPYKEIFELCEENKCVVLGGVFKVKRGKGECDALFFNHCKESAKIYCECYTFEKNKQGYNRVTVSLWVWNENDYNAAKKALTRTEVKAFFDSIEYL